MFAADRAWSTPTTPGSPRSSTAAAPSPSQRSRTPLRAAAVLLVGAIVAAGVVLLRQDDDPEPQYRGAASASTVDSPALADAPWREEAYREIGEASAGTVYTSYTGWSLRDYEGEYVNISNRVRRSYEPSVPPDVDPWTSGSRRLDDVRVRPPARRAHDPLRGARLAEAAGIPVRVRNYGTAGYVNYQSVVLLSLLAELGRTAGPGRLLLRPPTTPATACSPASRHQRHRRAHDLEGRSLRTAIRRRAGGARHDPADLPSPLRDRIATSSPTAAAIAEDVVQVYEQGVAVSDALSGAVRGAGGALLAAHAAHQVGDGSG